MGSWKHLLLLGPSGTRACDQKGWGPEGVCLGLACSLWALNFMQERFHKMSPGDFENTFIKAGGSGRAEEGEDLGRAALVL